MTEQSELHSHHSRWHKFLLKVTCGLELSAQEPAEIQKLAEAPHSREQAKPLSDCSAW